MAQETILVDSVAGIHSLLHDIESIPKNSSPNNAPSLYLDIEGVNLGRTGSVSILSIYVLQANVYLVDVHALGDAAFTTESAGGRSLKGILEDKDISKAFFDIRNDSDALYSLHKVSVAGIHDLQLMELACRGPPRRVVSGLARCIERDARIPKNMKNQWLQAKKAGERLWSPEQGGGYEVFNERPLRPEITKYCSQDVALLPQLWKVYNDKIGGRASASMWRAKIARETLERIKLSQSASYEGKGRHKALAPPSFA